MGHFATLLLVWLGHFLVDFMIGVWAVYKTLSSFDLAIAGLMAAVCALAGEGGQLVFGGLADNGERKRLIAIGILLTGASAFFPFTNSYLFSFCLLLTTCIGSGAFHPSAVSLVGSLTNERKGLYISIFASGGALGMALSQAIFFEVSQETNHALFLFLPQIFLVGTLFFLGYFKKEPLLLKGLSRPHLSFSLFREYFKNRSLRTLYILQVCNQTLCWGMIFLLPDVLKERGYQDWLAFGGGHMVFILGSAFTMIPSGYFADKFSARKVILVASSLGMCFFFAFLSFPELSDMKLLTILFFTGSFLGIIQPLAVALGNELGKENPGLVSAFTMGMVWCISEPIGLGASGLLTKLFSEDAPAKALMIFGAAFPFLIQAAKELPKELTLEKIPTID